MTTPALAAATTLPVQAQLDGLEEWMLERFEARELPLEHRFTPGLYAREIFMPSGTLLTSKIHRTAHPFVVLSGRVRVWIEGEGIREFTAGHVGITQPGTRRLLYIVEDCRWITFHPLTDEESERQDLEAIEARLIEKRELSDGSTAHDRYIAALLRQGIEGPAAPTLQGQYEYGGAP